MSKKPHPAHQSLLDKREELVEESTWTDETKWIVAEDFIKACGLQALWELYQAHTLVRESMDTELEACGLDPKVVRPQPKELANLAPEVILWTVTSESDVELSAQELNRTWVWPAEARRDAADQAEACGHSLIQIRLRAASIVTREVKP